MPCRVIQVVGYKNTGKTTLIERLTDRLTCNGYIVGTIKHDAHHFDTDHPGTDTWRHRKAGAQMTAITSDQRTVLMQEQASSLADLLQVMASMDIVLVEGFKHERYPKIVMIKSDEDFELIERLREVKAAVMWDDVQAIAVPCFSIHDIDGLSGWLEEVVLRSNELGGLTVGN